MIVQTNSGKKLSGFFRGTVVHHCESGNGRCKVFIPGVYPEQYEKDYKCLPDAEQITPLFGGSHKGNGIFSYPNIGSVVVCAFWNEDQNYPFFFGSTLGGENSGSQYIRVNEDLREESRKNGKDAIKHVINSGNSRIEIYEPGYIQIKALGDSTSDKTDITIDGKGNLLIHTTKKVQVNSDGDISFKAPGSFTVDAGSILLKAATKTVVVSPKFIVASGSEINMLAPSISFKATTLGLFSGPSHTTTFN